jgi:hypothetical protein
MGKIKRQIDIKGYYNAQSFDAQLQKSTMDLKYGNGFILFTGTQEEYDNLLDFLIDNEGKSGIKWIGSHNL